MTGEIAARLLAQACLRAAAARGLPAAVLRRGDPDAGILYVKTLARDGQATLFVQTRDDDGLRAWRMMQGPAPEADIDAKLAREAEIDPDLWAVEVMDDEHRHPLDPKLV